MKYKLFFCLIVLLTFILRFWQLGINPPSLDWDEASLGYNAYSILKTGKDEYGSRLPLAIRSFNDYKPPLYTYLSILPIAFFGLNEFSVRFISALLGSLTVIISLFLIREGFTNKSNFFYLTFFILLSISPWHIQFTRIAFEANIALFFVILGFYLFIKGLKNGYLFIFAFIFLGLSIYAYHSPRLFVPIMMFISYLLYRKQIKTQIIWFITGIILFTFVVAPIYISISTSTSARFGSVSVINPNEKLGSSIKSIELDIQNNDLVGKIVHNRRLIYLKEILAGYLDHFNFDFLFLTGDPPGRHHAAGMGMLYLYESPFILLGLILLIKYSLISIFPRFIIFWFIFAPIASSLTSGTPHAVRALLYLPTYQIFAALGIYQAFTFIKKIYSSYTQKVLLSVIFLLILLNFYYYLHMYWIHTPLEYSQWWQYGYKDVVQEVAKKDKVNNYNKILVTYKYDQPYIFFLFYNQIDPFWYQNNWGTGEINRANREFGKFEFRNINWEEDSKLRNVLIVGTPSEIPPSVEGLIKEIFFLDNTVAFRIVER